MAPSNASAGELEQYQDMLNQLHAGDVQNPATQDALQKIGLEDVPPSPVRLPNRRFVAARYT